MQQGEFLNPKDVIDSLDISEDSVICDFGCGSNGWTVPLARIASKGMVYAVDLSEDDLALLESSLKRLEINNVKILLSDLEKGVKINDKEIDLLIIANLLFEIDDQSIVLKEGRRILKDGGQMVIIDWNSSNPFGLKDELVDFNKLKESILKIDLKLEKEVDLGSYHRCLIIRKI
jgi:ubiquinone/menaquinone biosynthesis C-methylase UbiE